MTRRMSSSVPSKPHTASRPSVIGKCDAHAAHQHELVDPVGVLGGDAQPDAAAEAVADEVGLLDAEGVHQPDGLVGPGVEAVLHALGPVGVAEPDHVGGDDVEVLGQRRDHQPPVGVRRDARAGAVHEHHGRVGLLAVLQVVRADAVGDRALPDLRPLRGAHDAPSCSSGRRGRRRSRASAPPRSRTSVGTPPRRRRRGASPRPPRRACGCGSRRAAVRGSGPG